MKNDLRMKNLQACFFVHFSFWLFSQRLLFFGTGFINVFTKGPQGSDLIPIGFIQLSEVTFSSDSIPIGFIQPVRSCL